MQSKPLLTRKDIAQLLGDVTPRQVELNESKWGLSAARRDLNRRCVRYCRRIALQILKSRGFIDSFMF